MGDKSFLLEPDASCLFFVNKLKQSGYSAFLVGGYIRDHILGIPCFDVDITTNALPEEVEKVFSECKVIETGIKHGTVTVIHDGIPAEITTFRREGSYSDNRHPDSVQFTDDIHEDLSRRDFTVNTLAYEPDTGLIDDFGGISDIENKLIRCVGDPDRRFAEDALRILRALRFSSILGFNVERETSVAIHKNRYLLKNIAVERINEELLKLLCGQNVKDILTEYFDIFCVIIPELEPLKGLEQHNPEYDYDAFEFTCNTVENIEAKSEHRLAALLHDIAKPYCFTLDVNGIGHFYDHEIKGSEMAADIMRRMKCSNETINKVTAMIRYHAFRFYDIKTDIKKLLNTVGEEYFFDILSLIEADNISKGALKDSRGYYRYIRKTAQDILDSGECYSMAQLAVDGNDLMSMGYDGVSIGKELDQLLFRVIEGYLPNDRSLLLRVADMDIQYYE